MKSTDIPARFPIPFGASAGVGYIRPVPTTPSGVPGQASLQEGFPPANFSPLNAGGVPPFGQDMNGILNRSTAWNRWQATGAFPPYDPTFQTAIAGYPAGSCVASLVQFGLVWLSLVDDNVTNPDAGGAGWFRYLQVVTGNVELYVNAATGNDNNNGLSPATAFATIQAAIDRAFGFPPSQYTININVADGNYAGFATPFQSGPTCYLKGNSVTPANVLIDGGTAPAVQVTGSNTFFCEGVRVTSSGLSNGYGFYAGGGASLSTLNTESGTIGASVFRANSATIYISGAHKFNGSAGFSFIAATYGASVFINTSLLTLVSAMTVGAATATVASNGNIFMISPAPTWGGGGTVSGVRYNATLCGTINVQGVGATAFPGSSPGVTATGGQYV